jgi:hypothetical protein
VADEELREEGIGSDPLFANIHRQLTEAGIEFDSPFQVEQPRSGLSARMMHKIEENVAIVLPVAKQALARGNIDFIRYECDELLKVFRINLDPQCADYRKLAMAVIKAEVRALEDIRKRNRGETHRRAQSSKRPDREPRREGDRRLGLAAIRLARRTDRLFGTGRGPEANDDWSKRAVAVKARIYSPFGGCRLVGVNRQTGHRLAPSATAAAAALFDGGGDLLDLAIGMTISSSVCGGRWLL